MGVCLLKKGFMYFALLFILCVCGLSACKADTPPTPASLTSISDVSDDLAIGEYEDEDNPHYYAVALREFMDGASGKTSAVLFDLDGCGADEMIVLDEGIADPVAEGSWGAVAIGFRFAVFDLKSEGVPALLELGGVTHSVYKIYISSRNEIVLYDVYHGFVYLVYSYSNETLKSEAALGSHNASETVFYFINGNEYSESEFSALEFNEMLNEYDVENIIVILGTGSMGYFWYADEIALLRDDTETILELTRN
jgi:hypothetical protein